MTHQLWYDSPRLCSSIFHCLSVSLKNGPWYSMNYMQTQGLLGISIGPPTSAPSVTMTEIRSRSKTVCWVSLLHVCCAMLRQAGRPKGLPDLKCHFGLQVYITRVRREDWTGTGQRAQQAHGCQQYGFKTPAPKKSQSKQLLVACLATVAYRTRYTHRSRATTTHRRMDRGLQKRSKIWQGQSKRAAH